MKVTVQEDKVLIEVDSTELATLDYSLGSFLQLAASPRSIGDHADPADVERANEMEKELWAAWCKMSDGPKEFSFV